MAKRAHWVWIVFVAIGLGAAGWWWFSHAPIDETSAAAAGDGLDRDEILARKWAARGQARLERTPCSARGRVARASDGTGIENAVVMLRMASALDPRAYDPVVVVTDATGEWVADAIPPGNYNISATAAGFAPVVLREQQLEAGKDHADLLHELPEGASALSGTVTGIDGEPIAGVRIEASPTTEQQLGATAWYATISDAQGEFELPLLPAAYVVQAHHADYVPVARRVLLRDRERTLSFSLIEGSVVRGVVRTREGGRPVPEARIQAIDPRSVITGNTASYRTVLADADGAFELRGLAAGVAMLSAQAEGWTSVQPTEVPVGTADEVEGIEITVDPAVTISGFVVSADDETKGVAGVMVMGTNLAEVSGGTGAIQAAAPSEADGYFELRGARPGHYNLMAMGTDILPEILSSSVEVTGNDVDDVLLTVDLGQYVQGKVDPGVSAQIHASIPMDEQQEIGPLTMVSFMRRMMSTFKAVRSDSDGTFSYGPVAEGRYTLEAYADDGRVGKTEIDVDEGGATGLVIPLQQGRSLEGTVRDSEGDPVDGVSVVLHEAVEIPAFRMSAVVGGGGREAVTDANGHFEIASVTAGRYHVSVRDDALLRVAWARSEDPEHPFDPKEIEISDRDSGPLELEVEPVDAVLRGVVENARGEPIAGAVISAWPGYDDQQWLEVIDAGPANAALSSARSRGETTEASKMAGMYKDLGRAYATTPVVSDARGRFELVGLRAGAHTISAETERGRLRALEHGVMTGTEAKVVLAEPGTIAIVLGGVEPAGDYRISVDGPERWIKRVRPAQTGVTLERVLPGTYEIDVSAEGGMVRRQVEVAAGQRAELSCELHPWGEVRGRVVAFGGEPVSGLAFIVMDELDSYDSLLANAGTVMSAMTGETKEVTADDGTFVVQRLPPGPSKITFVAVPTLQSRAVVEVDLQPGQRRDVGTVYALGPRPDRPGTAGWTLEAGPEPPGSEAASAGEGWKPDRLWVVSVETGGAAQKAGVRAGDRIVAVDETKIGPLHPKTAAELLRERIEASEPLRVEVQREDETRALEIVPAVAAARD